MDPPGSPNTEAVSGEPQLCRTVTQGPARQGVDSEDAQTPRADPALGREPSTVPPEMSIPEEEPPSALLVKLPPIGNFDRGGEVEQDNKASADNKVDGGNILVSDSYTTRSGGESTSSRVSRKSGSMYGTGMVHVHGEDEFQSLDISVSTISFQEALYWDARDDELLKEKKSKLQNEALVVDVDECRVDPLMQEEATIQETRSGGAWYSWRGFNLDKWLYKVLWTKKKKILALILPVCFLQFCYWNFMHAVDMWDVFADYWALSTCMVLGGFIAGFTGKGGAAVAYPVMSIVFAETVTISRDASLVLQAAGMGASSVTIMYMSFWKVEWTAIIWSNIGGAFGVVFGFLAIDPYLPPAYAKMAFVTIFLGFTTITILMNVFQYKRKVYTKIQDVHLEKKIVLLVGGAFAGALAAISGSGMGVMVATMLVCVFDVSEKVAMPTSVMSMAVNTVITLYFRIVWFGGIEHEGFRYGLAAAPVVVACAPFGAFVGSYCHRLILAGVVNIVDIFQFLTAVAIVLPAESGLTIGIILIMCLAIYCGVVGSLTLFRIVKFVVDKIRKKKMQRVVMDSPTAAANHVGDDSVVGIPAAAVPVTMGG